MKDPYAVLGIPRDASNDDIKRAFRHLARTHHPDRAPNDPAAEATFKELAAAYELLSHPQRRAVHDHQAANAARRPKPSRPDGHEAADAQPEDPDDAHNHWSRAAEAYGFRANGNDVIYTLSITLREAVSGVTKSVAMTTGKQLAVKVPAGAFDGQILRLKDQGFNGLGGGAPGHAMVKLALAPPSPPFTRDGDDISVDVPMTLPEAVLGGSIDAPLPEGEVRVRVPAGSNSGTKLRLKGKGVPRASGGRGDAYLVLKVVLPSQPDDEFIRFVETWSRRHPYRVKRSGGGRT